MTLQIGAKFSSYRDLKTQLDKFCKETQCKFWKRDARTIDAARTAGVHKFLNPAILYYEIRFSCIYGGVDFKSRGKNLRSRSPSIKRNGCPVYLRFKASEDGTRIQLVAVNLRHNHELKLPERKPKVQKPKELSNRVSKQKKELSLLEEMDNVEIIEQGKSSSEDDYDDEEIAYVNDMIDDDDEEDDDDVPIDFDYNKIMANREEIEGPFTYRGFIAPAFTPFCDDGSLNLSCILPYAKYLAHANINGVLVNGTSGEGTLMTVKERMSVTEAWAEACSQTQLHLMVQVGGAALPDVIEMAKHAEAHKAASILCLPELFHKPKTCKELIQYLQMVSEAAPNTPLLYYHIPSQTGVNIHMGKFLNEIKNQIPMFSGIKFTSTALDEGIAAVNTEDKRFAVFLGADTILAGAFAQGFDSVIATTLNIFPDHGLHIFEAIASGNIQDAQLIQDQLNSAIEVIIKSGSWVPTMKQAMNLLTPVSVGPIRPPLVPLTSAEVTQIKTDLQELKIIEEVESTE